MPLACLLVDHSPVTADPHSISIAALVRRHELDAELAVPVDCQSTNDDTHWQASPTLPNGQIESLGR